MFVDLKIPELDVAVAYAASVHYPFPTALQKLYQPPLTFPQ